MYKDDSIFDHMTFFKDVDLNKKVFKKKDQFPAKGLLGRPVEISSESEKLTSPECSLIQPVAETKDQDLSIIHTIELSGIVQATGSDIQNTTG